MSASFKKRVHKKERIVERSESYHADIEGYEVVFYDDENHGARLSIYPHDSGVFPRAGIIEMRPERVVDIDNLAAVLPDLLRAIASHLRGLGKDDLRSRHSREYEALTVSMNGRLRK
jgi:hypothetical protein